ncbi:hypothetical protein [Paenibacillus sp. BAC0078]
MSEVIDLLEQKLKSNDLDFMKKPILIGGMAMEYYGMRKSGADIDLLICDEDYQSLAMKKPDKRKDLYGDLGVVIDSFEIWRSIALLDYDFYLKDAIDEGVVFVVSLDRLLFMRVIAMDVEKYMNDLKRMREYYYENFRNQAFLQEAEKHISSYEKNNGVVFEGNYID